MTEATETKLQRPRLQIALDTTDMPSALRPLNKAISQIDVIECGTILIIAEGSRPCVRSAPSTRTRRSWPTCASPRPAP
ncbi:hypothetical protein [Bifidobacterium callitrichos]|uniref:hypothetical protein n=1 Tax=Bifidobacterium callitrichos TaxID=762209 RepID=UPI00193094D1|nr:hypothetical protein [Bifidobacterium callitrichos]